MRTAAVAYKRCCFINDLHFIRKGRRRMSPPTPISNPGTSSELVSQTHDHAAVVEEREARRCLPLLVQQHKRLLLAIQDVGDRGTHLQVLVEVVPERGIQEIGRAYV